MRAIVPSSLTTSASTPAGASPAMPGQVDGGLGVTGPLQHAALAVAQREDVPGPREVFGAGWRVEERVHGGARSAAEIPVRRPVAGVDRHGERGALRLGVVAHHQRDAAARRGGSPSTGMQITPLVWRTMNAIASARHLLGRHDEVALVLTVGVVDDDHDLAPADRGDGVLDVVNGMGSALSRVG